MQSRDDAEDALVEVVGQTTRTFLQRVLDAVLAAIQGGRFRDAQPVLALGVLLNWWTDEVSERVVMSIQESWKAAFTALVGDDKVLSPRADAMAFHITAVKDRLSRNALPEIPEAAFEEVRLSQSTAALTGKGIEWQSRDIAERLAWEPDKSYWKQVKADAEHEIDKILDPLGKPGTPSRTYAHKHDPNVAHWQKVRAGAVDKIKEDEGDWKVRAERIARTEATAAWNSGSLAALADEGSWGKEWVASEDDRTRDSHKHADGQVVPLSRPFKVGDSLLMMPGDPAAPPWEVINCRCTVVGADNPTKAITAAAHAAVILAGVNGTARNVQRAIRLLALESAAFGLDQARVPKGNGKVSGRWLDMPGTILEDLVHGGESGRGTPLPTVDVPSADINPGDGVLLNNVVHEVTARNGDNVTARSTATDKEVKVKSKTWKKVLLALSALALLAGLVMGGAAVSGGDHDAAPVPQTTTSAPVEVKTPAPTTAAGYAQMFDKVSTDEWGGADVSISAGLPDGRRVWLYGDTVSKDNGFVHSTGIVQDGGDLHVSDGGKQLLPNGPDTADGRQTIYWIDGVKPTGNGDLLVTSMEMSIGQRDAWDFKETSPGKSKQALVSVDDNGNLHFEGWQGWVPTPTKGNPHKTDDFKTVAPHHFTYGGVTHDIRLANGKYLHTLSQNYDDGFEAHMKDGALDYEAWRPIFSAASDGAFSLTASGIADQARVPRGNGKVSGRWLDMPGTVLANLTVPDDYVPNLVLATPKDKAAFKAKHNKSIPPSWTDVQVDLNDDASLVARGKDTAGRTVRLYSQAHHDRQAAKKFERLKEIGASLPALDKALASIDGDPTKAAARLMYTEGIRVGSTDEQLGKAKAYGATTLRTEHAKVTPEGVHLSFVAKEGIPVEYDITDPELVRYLEDRLGAAKPGDLLFDTDSNKTMRLLRDSSGVAGIKNHDLRTLLANRMAAAYLDELTPPPPTDAKSLAALRRKIGQYVSEQLRNKPAQALSSYINPAIFAAIQEA